MVRYTLFCRKIVKTPTEELSYDEIKAILLEIFHNMEFEGMQEKEYNLVADFASRVDDYILETLDKKKKKKKEH